MSKFELKLPQMGESVAEATLTSWLKEVGDVIELDEAVFEIATDKVDSEVPSEVEGVLVEKLFKVDDIIKVGQTVAVIERNGEMADAPKKLDKEVDKNSENPVEAGRSNSAAEQQAEAQREDENVVAGDHSSTGLSDRFYSPLVKNIAQQEGISRTELDAIPGTGSEGRVTKNDILNFVASRSITPGVEKTSHRTAAGSGVEKTAHRPAAGPVIKKVVVQKEEEPEPPVRQPVKKSAGVEVIPLTRMGKLIAQHMVNSIHTSAHVQSFVEVDVTNVVNWRNRVKEAFEKREGEKLTFTPIFIEAVAKALKHYPMMNISLDGDDVIKKKHINIGMAAALPDGNLIVPVIKNADLLNLVGMAKVVNDLASRARTNSLKPDEIQDGTYTVTNVGTFGSVFGTPIINQPQVGILALGAIRKMPAVIETEDGDFIGIRSKMFLSHSYDHRVVNGALGGMFVKAIADHLQEWDLKREI